MHLSKTNIRTFCGNIVTLRLLSEKNISKENIIWSSSDESIVFIRDFKTTGAPNFSDGVLLIMMGEGRAQIKAELNGEEYICDVESGKRQTASPDDKMNFYFGDFHTHTGKIHKNKGFINSRLITAQSQL